MMNQATAAPTTKARATPRPMPALAPAPRPEGSWVAVGCGADCAVCVAEDEETVLETVLETPGETVLEAVLDEDDAGIELDDESSIRKETEVKGDPKFVPFTI